MGLFDGLFGGSSGSGSGSGSSSGASDDGFDSDETDYGGGGYNSGSDDDGSSSGYPYGGGYSYGGSSGSDDGGGSSDSGSSSDSTSSSGGSSGNVLDSITGAANDFADDLVGGGSDDGGDSTDSGSSGSSGGSSSPSDSDGDSSSDSGGSGSSSSSGSSSGSSSAPSGIPGGYEPPSGGGSSAPPSDSEPAPEPDPDPAPDPEPEQNTSPPESVSGDGAPEDTSSPAGSGSSAGGSSGDSGDWFEEDSTLDNIGDAVTGSEEPDSGTDSASSGPPETVPGVDDGGSPPSPVDDVVEGVQDVAEDPAGAVDDATDGAVSDAVDAVVDPVDEVMSGGSGGGASAGSNPSTEPAGGGSNESEGPLAGVGEWAENKADQAGEAVSEGGEAIQEGGEEVVETGQEVAEEGKESLEEGADYVSGKVEDGKEQIGSGFNDVREGLMNRGRQAQRGLQEVRETASSGLSTAYRGAAAFGGAAAGPVDESIGSALGEMRSGDARGFVDELTPGGVDSYAGNVGQEVRQGDVTGTLDDLAGGVDEAASDYAGGMDVLLGSTDEAAGEAFESAKEGDVAGIGDALAGGTDEAVASAVQDARGGDWRGVGDSMFGGLDEAGGGTIDWAQEAGGIAKRGAVDVASGAGKSVSRAAGELQEGDIAGAGDKLVGGMDEGAAEIADLTGEKMEDADQFYRDAGQAVKEGDLERLKDLAAEQAGEDLGYIANVGDVAAGGVDDYVRNASLNTDVTDTMTKGGGGFISEEGEKKLRKAGQNFTEDLGTVAETTMDLSPTTRLEKGTISAYEEVTGNDASNVGVGPVTLESGGEGPTERLGEGAVKGVGGLGNAFSWAQMGESGIEAAQNTPSAVQEYGGPAVASTIAAGGRKAATATAGQLVSNPAESAGSLVAETVTGIGIAKKLEDAGTAARVMKRSKLGGETEYTPEDFMGDDLAREFDPTKAADSNEMVSPFRPDGDDADIVDTTVRQSRENTPDEITEQLDPSEQEGVMKHASPHRFDDQFEAGIPKTRPEDPDNAMFFSPEAEPYFAGLERGVRSGAGSVKDYVPTSPSDLRLPSIRGGGNKNIVLSKMEVDRAPDIPGEKATMEAPDEALEETMDRLQKKNPDLNKRELQRKAAKENPDFGYDENRGVMQLTKGEESKWLESEAEAGRGYVRGGSNMNMGESEVVVKGGSRFEEVANPGFVRMQDEILDVRVFEPSDAKRAAGAAESAGDVADSAETVEDAGDAAARGNAPDAGGYTQEDLYELAYYGGEQDGTPYLPTYAPSSGGGRAGTGSQPGFSGHQTRPTSPIARDLADVPSREPPAEPSPDARGGRGPDSRPSDSRTTSGDDRGGSGRPSDGTDRAGGSGRPRDSGDTRQRDGSRDVARERDRETGSHEGERSYRDEPDRGAGYRDRGGEGDSRVTDSDRGGSRVTRGDSRDRTTAPGGGAGGKAGGGGGSDSVAGGGRGTLPVTGGRGGGSATEPSDGGGATSGGSPGGSTGESPGGGPGSGPTTAPSDRGNDPGPAPPGGFPPPRTYGSPEYGVPTPPTGPSRYTSGGGGGGIPYVPNYGRNRIRQEIPATEEEDEESPNMWKMGYFGRGWINPVASGQQATAALFGGGDSALDVVEKDIQGSMR